MYLSCKIKIPDTGGKITSKTISGTTYVYYEYARDYNKEKKYTEPKRTCIGKRDMEQPDFLYPNEKFLKYYPDYAYNHALFTNDMRIYSDSKISDFLQEVTIDQRIRFLNEWNAKRDHWEKIYISYDSTNKASQAGDIDLVELGHAKEGVETDIFNYSIAFDTNNREPLFYESYPGSIVDVSQLQHTLKKAKSYGYEHVGFILDRGYFCKENIQFMDENGHQFVIMAKGMKKLVSELVLEVQGDI